MNCIETSCQGGIKCCVNISEYPGFYCKVISQCQQQPLWQVIVIPSLLAFLTLSLAFVVLVKLRGQSKQKRDITTYAYQQIRVKPKAKAKKDYNQNKTFTYVPVPLDKHNIKTKQKISQATQNKVTKSPISSPKDSNLQ